MRKSTIATTVTLAFVLGLGLAACEQEKPKGPAEKIGAHLDDAAREVKDAAKDAKHDVEKAVDDAKDELDD